MNFRCLCCSCFFLFLSPTLYAQVKHPISATRISTPPKVDGIINDVCWSEGKPYNQFYQGAPEVGVPSDNTEVMIIYDDGAIYIAAKCFMRRDSLWLQLTQRDQLSDDADAIFVGFDTYHDGQNAFGFGVSTRGVQSDFKMFQNTEEDATWDAVWESKVSMDEKGWYAEFKIPYSALRFPKTQTQDWAIDFYRIIRHNRHEYHSCNFDPKENGIVSQWQPLVGLSEISPPLRLSLSPYATVYYNLYRDNKLDLTTHEVDFKGGMDLKWGVSESFTLDATLIPDFGQVPSDNVVYSLSAFEVYYDEKRPFFTEGIELFNKAELFYSRRVGFLSDYYEEHRDTGVTIFNFPVNTKLINASKFSGRTNNGLGVGIFNAVTGNTYAEGVTSENEIKEVLVDPLTNFNVLVFDQSLKNNSFLTFTNTNVVRDAKGRDANVANVLTYIANKENSFAGYGYFAVSTLLNEQEDGNQEFTNGTLTELGFEKISGNFTFDASHRTISAQYNQEDLGFLEINNDNLALLELSYDIYEPFGKFNELHWFNGLYYNYRHEGGHFISSYLQGNYFMLTNKYFGFFSYYFASPWGFYNYYEPRVEGKFYREPAVYEIGAGFSTDYRKHVALDLEGGPAIWNEQGRIKYRWFIAPRFRIGKNLLIIPSSHTHLYRNDIGFVDIDSASNIIFGRRNIDEVDNIININYYLNATTSIGTRVRYYTNKGIYDQYYVLNDDGSVTPTTYNGSGNYNFNAWNIDLNFSWWFLPGSEINIVWKNAIIGLDDITNLNFLDNFEHTFDSPVSNNFSVRIQYYIDYQMVKKMVK